MKTKTLIAAMIGLSLAAIGTADAAGKHKRYKVQRHGGAVMSLPAPPSGPPWPAVGMLHRRGLWPLSTM